MSIIKPLAPNQYERKRWEHTSLRRRLILGVWAEDLEKELARHLPPDRRASWGPSDLSSNPFEQITRQLSVLYHETPSITHAEGVNIDPLVSRDGLVTRSGLWNLMQRGQQLILGLREGVARIDVNPEMNSPMVSGIQYRIITPDMVYCESHPDQPDIPVYYREYRLRQFPNGKMEWVADVIDIRDPNNPTFRMYKVDKDSTLGEDVSQLFMGENWTENTPYPYTDSQGRPFLPIVLYHAEKTGQLWDPFNGLQAVAGTLVSACLYTMWGHLVKDSCWSQKYISGLTVAGLDQMDMDSVSRRSSIATDPSSILVFQQDPDASGQPLVGAFPIPTDPHSLLESIAKYETRVALSAGLSPSDISRQSADPRSGFALAVSKAGQREAQKKFAPVFRAGDEELLAKTAMLANKFLGTNLPESGYRVSYHSLPLSPEEMKAQREDIVQKMNAGLISPVQAVMMMYDDMDEREARDYLRKIKIERAEYII